MPFFEDTFSVNLKEIAAAPFTIDKAVNNLFSITNLRLAGATTNPFDPTTFSLRFAYTNPAGAVEDVFLVSPGTLLSFDTTEFDGGITQTILETTNDLILNLPQFNISGIQLGRYFAFDIVDGSSYFEETDFFLETDDGRLYFANLSEFELGLIDIDNHPILGQSNMVSVLDPLEVVLSPTEEIPEPYSLLLFAAAGGLLARRRR